MRSLVLLLAACAGAPTPDTGSPGDTGDSGDTGVVDTDTGGDSDTDLALPCEGSVGVLSFPGAASGVLDRDDPQRWTGSGDYPTELWAVELTGDPVALTVTYPDPQLGTSTRYYLQVAWLDDACKLHYGTASTRGGETHHVLVWYTPTKAGWWFPLLYFPEAMPNPGSVTYDVAIGPQE